MTIDISRVPKPTIIEQKSLDTILAELTNNLLSRYPQCADVINDEAEPLLYLLQTYAYDKFILLQQVNDAALSLFLAYAENSTLDSIGQDRFKKPRLVITPQDDSTNPPTPAVMETDDDYRQRLWLSMDALSTAGPKGAYESLALDAHGDIAHANAVTTSPGTIVVYIVSDSNNGQASAELTDLATAAVSDDEKRAMTDHVSAQAASINQVTINAQLHIANGIDSAGASEVLAAAIARTEQLKTRRRVGETLAVSKIYAALHVDGVDSVTLTSPIADINPGQDGAAVIVAINVTLAA